MDYCRVQYCSLLETRVRTTSPRCGCCCPSPWSPWSHWSPRCPPRTAGSWRRCDKYLLRWQSLNPLQYESGQMFRQGERGCPGYEPRQAEPRQRRCRDQWCWDWQRGLSCCWFPSDGDCSCLSSERQTCGKSPSPSPSEVVWVFLLPRMWCEAAPRNPGGNSPAAPPGWSRRGRSRAGRSDRSPPGRSHPGNSPARSHNFDRSLAGELERREESQPELGSGQRYSDIKLITQSSPSSPINHITTGLGLVDLRLTLTSLQIHS